ncbi:ABC transporter substrate-binding protein [Bifidobacterium callimiconis]|uniref:Sugar ABC transporter substrate-binding protein n=1 Tax=Bifidobacterium callimiconis TaxID=2306973 RepID=A0A430FHL0_9BIFI|nr:ABC transporter substrate-binding protein [Bifidobacterium callimiconis]RSX52374.1 sugar ABC transporter substrate-binding protein [Bifidobacterium callimiconis]
MRIRRTLLPAVLAATLALAGCGSTGSGQDTTSEATPDTTITGNVTITFWHGMTGDQEKTLQQITDAFMKENPKITVKLQNQSSYDGLQQKLTAAQQSPKNLPTITQAYSSWMINAIDDDLVVDQTPYIESKDQNLKFDNWDDVLEGLRKSVTLDGKIYGMPFNKSTEVLWYNKDMFDELGLKVPTSFEELETTAKAIHDAKGIPGAGFDSLQNFYSVYLSDHGSEFGKDLDVTSKASQDAFTYYQDGVRDGWLRTAGTDQYMSAPFASEKVGMYIGSSAGESFVKEGAAGKFTYAAAPEPSKHAIQQGTDIYMFTSASSQQRTAAYLYEKYLTGKDNQITWGVQTGYIPIRTSAITDSKYTSADTAIAPILADATRNLIAAPIKPSSEQATTDVEKSLEAVLADPNSSVKDALAKLKPTFESDWQE